MSLTEPRAALAENSGLIDYLVGLAALGRLVRTLSIGGGERRDADDFVHVLLGLAALGARVERLAPPAPPMSPVVAPDSSVRWLR
ncbi:hypothetical protein A5784_34345 [Mycobacterium sp. 852013-50091_SCH5140682]|uniref:hypothetical protein n=1 Tax=Mycobacterium sp. 852013-50091_SCH5140682 TaxID=1834109 RepID=UPI0007EBDBFB|nr:hypothetical protein [Mycobacterium sp. 852013-50091_SCH5140682]OBC11594.1 hypothetical protein A5784_34345 [Mycobacterium sp. 852013-50091_SCH5140682]